MDLPQAEKFRQVYDNEWTDAFEDLHKKVLDEKETVSMLSEIVKVMCYHITFHCTKFVNSTYLNTHVNAFKWYSFC